MAKLNEYKSALAIGMSDPHSGEGARLFLHFLCKELYLCILFLLTLQHFGV